MGITESSFFGCAGSEGYSKDWSPSSVRAPQHKPNDSTRIGAGQSSFRGRVRCQSPFIAGERRRCEPGSNSVIVTNALTSVEGHVLRLGGVLRTRKIFVGCPAIRPIWDQSPMRPSHRSETVGNRLYPIHGQDCLRRSTAEAQIQDRSRDKTGPNTAPGFLRAKCPFREAQTPDDGARKRSDRGGCPRTPPSSPRRREPREKQSTPFTPFAKAGTQGKTKHAANPTHTPAPFPKRRGPKRPIQAQRPRGMPPSFPRRREPREKQSTPIDPHHHHPLSLAPPSFPRTPPSSPRRREPRGG